MYNTTDPYLTGNSRRKAKQCTADAHTKSSINVDTKKTTLPTFYIYSQEDIEKLELEGTPQLIRLDATFMHYVCPPLLMHHNNKLNTLAKMEPGCRDEHHKKVKHTDIFMDVLFAKEQIIYSEDEESVIIPSIDTFSNNNDGLDKEGFVIAVKNLLYSISVLCSWNCACSSIVMLCTILCTLACFPQAPHTDYPKKKSDTNNKRKSFIFAISSMGAYLLCWPKSQPNNPMIIFIPFGFGILFGPELIHAEGLGYSEDTEKVLEDPLMGCPQAHFYVVSDIKDLPLNFICYDSPDRNKRTYNSEYSSVSGRVCIKMMNEMKEMRVAATNLSQVSDEKKAAEPQKPLKTTPNQSKSNARSGNVGDFSTPKEKTVQHQKPTKTTPKQYKSNARSGKVGDFSMPEENKDFKHQRHKRHKIKGTRSNH